MDVSLNVLNDFWLVQAMKYSLWLYPTVESLHICGIGMLFGSVVLMDLRLLGVCPHIEFRALSRLGLAVSLFGFALAVLTGSMMFMTHAADLIGSRLFLIKICFIFLLLMNATVVHMRSGINAMSKVQAMVSLAGWPVVIGLGRWLAYV
jgi:hypothetical protein